MSLRRLIVTADDFGYSRRRNRGIAHAFRCGGVTRASLLVNASDVQDAVNIATELSIPLGLHLNLTEGIPLSPAQHVSTLLGMDGFLRGKQGFRSALYDGNIDLSQVSVEVRAQLLRFHALCGRLPLYVDGHQHVHVLPGVASVFASVLHEHGIVESRLPVERCVEDCDWLEPPQISFFSCVVQQARDAAKVFRKHGVRYSDGFVGLVTMGDNMTLERLTSQILDAFIGTTTEASICRLETSDEVLASVAALAQNHLHAESSQNSVALTESAGEKSIPRKDLVTSHVTAENCSCANNPRTLRSIAQDAQVTNTYCDTNYCEMHSLTTCEKYCDTPNEKTYSETNRCFSGRLTNAKTSVENSIAVRDSDSCEDRSSVQTENIRNSDATDVQSKSVLCDKESSVQTLPMCKSSSKDTASVKSGSDIKRTNEKATTSLKNSEKAISNRAKSDFSGLDDSGSGGLCENHEGRCVVTVELMVHPGYQSVTADMGCGVGADEFACSPAREHELRTLTSSKLLAWYSKEGISLERSCD